MQIVIDIDEDIYEHAKNKSEDSRDEGTAMRAIEKGVILPKNHGRLIDAGALDKEVISHVHSGDAESPKDCAKFSMMIITAPTIVGADKEETDGTN